MENGEVSLEQKQCEAAALKVYATLIVKKCLTTSKMDVLEFANNFR